MDEKRVDKDIKDVEVLLKKEDARKETARL
jgi:hypothetical protein